MDILFLASYGFFSFYLSGDFIGLRDNNLKTFALVGLTLGCVRDLTGKNLIQLLFKDT